MNSDLNRRILIVFFINFSFAIIEMLGGIWSKSLAIQSDAIHDFGDSLILGLAFLFESWSTKKPNSKYTFGFRRLSIFSSLFAGTVLIAGSLYILYSGISRLNSPVEPLAGWMIVFAILGLAFNLFAAYFLGGHSHGHGDPCRPENHHKNILRWHLIEDVLGWAAVLVGSIFIYCFKWYFIDTLLSVGIACFILYNATKSLKPIFKILLQSTPDGLDLKQIQKTLGAIEHVVSIHDLHFWSLDGSRHVVTMHVVVESPLPTSDIQTIKSTIRKKLSTMFADIHVTIEIEIGNEKDCGLLECVDHSF